MYELSTNKMFLHEKNFFLILEELTALGYFSLDIS